jgi:serine/threonine protein kinase/WD40 repeat protein
MNRHPIEELAEEFLARYRRGDRPVISEYTERYPDLAGEIRDLFPALMVMEEAGRRDADRNQVRGTVPDRVGDYRILREIGRGGMGIVYEAEHEALGRHIAIKVLPTHALLDSRHLERFRREARAAAKLHHTNIVPVFGVGEQAGLQFYVMQYIPGLGLDQILVELRRQRTGEGTATRYEAVVDSHHARIDVQGGIAHGADSAARIADSLVAGRFAAGPDRDSKEARDAGQAAEPISEPSLGKQVPSPLSDPGRAYWQSVARIGVQVADALAYAHSQGVLHRDIKPSNLLLDNRGTVWVTDFGLAKAADSDDLTHSGDIIGTLRYLAPERLRGRSDVRGDIYGLGITLYELLTLRPAFDESDRNHLVRRLEHEEPVRPRTIDPTIPRDLETVVLKSIAKEPSDRYQTAGEFAVDLSQFLEDKPVSARRAGVTEHTWRWCRRNPVIAGLAVALMVSLIVLTVGMGLMVLLHADRDRAITSERRAKEAEARAIAAETEVRVRSHLASAAAIRRSGRAGQRLECLEEIQKAMRLSPPRDLRRALRHEAIVAFTLADVGVRWKRTAASTNGVSCDPALERYASADPSSWDMIVRNMTDDAELMRVACPGGSIWFASSEFSPDGDSLAVVHYRHNDEAMLEVWSLSHRKRLHYQSLNLIPVALAFHPNGRFLAYCMPDHTLRVWDLAEDRELKRIPLGFAAYSLCFDSRGSRVAADDRTGTVAMIDLESGQTLSTLREQSSCLEMDWSADDRLLAVASFDGRIFVWNARSNELVSVLDGHPNSLFRVQFLGQGHVLATCGWDGTTRFWDAVTGEALLQVPGAFLRFQAERGQIGFIHDGDIGIWQLTSSHERRVLHPNAVGNRARDRTHALPNHTEFTSGGRLLATPSGDGASLWDGASLEALAHLEVGSVSRVLCHPRYEFLITVGGAGVLAWPIARDAGGSHEEWRIGPPRLVHELGPDTNSDYDAAWFPEFQSIAISDPLRGEVFILRVGAEGAGIPPVRLPSQNGLQIVGIDVSSDGKWLAVGGQGWPGIQVWDVAARRIECVLKPWSNTAPGSVNFEVAFSPDNRWLVGQAAGSNGVGIGYYWWQVGTWEPAHFVDAERTPTVGAAFSHDGRYIAASIAQNEILLADAASGSELVRLSTLPISRSWPTAFHPDGSRLVAIAYPDTIHAWNLDLVWQQLDVLGLGRDDVPHGQRPPFGRSSLDGPAIRSAAPTADVKPLRIIIDPGTQERCLLLQNPQISLGY